MRMGGYFLTVLSGLLHIVVPRVKVLLSSLRKDEREGGREGGRENRKDGNSNWIKYCEECGVVDT